MSLQLESTRETVRQQLVEVRPSRRVVVARPNSRADITLHVVSRFGLHVRLVVEGLEPSIARYTLAPEQGRTPFTSRLGLTIAPNAVGIYPFRITALDPTGTSYGATGLVLAILPHQLPMEILNYLQALLTYYKAYGIQYVIWYLIRYLFNDGGMSFTEIKAIYELLKRKKLSNGTVGDLLERMEKKGVVVKRRGRYYAGVKDEKLVLEAIDVKRVRAGRRGARKIIESLTDGSLMKRNVTEEESIPLAVKRILRIAEDLIEQGEMGKALGLIQHTLVGVRRTGRWILWVKDLFIYKERKAKPPYHYFTSKRIADTLRNLGVKEGFIHTKPVDTLIHNMFPQGYREARRIHYLLKSLGWIAYGPPLVLYIAAYPDGIGGFKLESLDGKTIVAINYDPGKAIKVVKSMVMPGEHVDEYNDDTYFRYK